MPNSKLVFGRVEAYSSLFALDFFRNRLIILTSLLYLQACQLPLFSYIVERLCACCYEQAWYAKLGGVVSIKFLMERLPLIWVLQNQLTFLKALLFVMMDLTGEVRKDLCLE